MQEKALYWDSNRGGVRRGASTLAKGMPAQPPKKKENTNTQCSPVQY